MVLSDLRQPPLSKSLLFSHKPSYVNNISVIVGDCEASTKARRYFDSWLRINLDSQLRLVRFFISPQTIGLRSRIHYP